MKHYIFRRHGLILLLAVLLGQTPFAQHSRTS